jgi:hypothetical protein
MELVMTRYLALAIVIGTAAAAGSAFADDIGIDTTPFHSTATRAEVRAELVRFRAAASDPWADYQPVSTFHSDRSRAQVRAEYLAARDTVASMNGEDSGSAVLARNDRKVGVIQVASRAGDAH